MATKKFYLKEANSKGLSIIMLLYQDKGKKFKYKPLNELLLSLSQAPMETQKEKLALVLEDWKGNLEQVDDILIVGIKL